MLLLEHEGKEILREYGIPTPSGVVIAKDATSAPQASLRFPAVLKAQVPVGGRGRAGGIVVAPTAQAFENASRALFATRSKVIPSSAFSSKIRRRRGTNTISPSCSTAKTRCC
jgi:succinyl-CoA synthetase beta subunit